MEKVLPGFEQMVGSGSVNSYESDPSHPYESAGMDRRQSRSSDDLNKYLLDGDAYDEYNLGVAPGTSQGQGEDVEGSGQETSSSVIVDDI